ncbi:DUF4350 domain-containing protein [Microbacterium sp. SLBN-146]|uniref:DUF4350 domain-containing protein n=1 Tax=Microbacterium sp. SLBN-146 TaxID=2768457 RepID=UPI00116E4A1C|nr:DUF4350 domain-containing protein [Microbacterium sp. SLBN-146]TQJ32701.1 uncharacterized protein DUF4350 [Microbacterium sp. SLBN-146]
MSTSIEIRETSRGRRVSVWIAIGIVVILIGILGGVLSGLGAWNQRNALDPESPAPLGTRAVAELLREQGVDVIIARDRVTALEELSARDATLVLPDAPALSDRGVETLVDAAMDAVLIQPRSRDLRLFLPGSTPTGVAEAAPVEPQCDLPEAERSGAVVPGRVFAPSGGAVIACYPAENESYGLLVQSDGEHRVAAVDGAALFVNESLAADGNAALALNLMGRHAVLVWYVPSLSDTDLADTTPSLGDLTPPWVSPAILILIAAGIAAAVWRGRRFGPLVAERLPVTVRASETTEGLGRLYAGSRDSVHAAEQLRIAALTRLARRLSLGNGATPTEIADAAAARIGADRGVVRGILVDDATRTDTDLLTLRARLRDLEDAVYAAVRPEGNPR